MQGDLDALVALGFLERRDGTYSNTPDCDLFLDKNKETYVGGMLEMANWMKSFVPEVPVQLIRTGEPFWSPK